MSLTGWPNVEGFGKDASVVAVVAWPTTCARGPDELEAKLPLAPKVALIACVPAGSAVVVKIATPPPFTAALPRVVPESENVTLPPGTPAEEVTVAVNVTDWPNVEGLGEDESPVVVLAWPTVWRMNPEVLVPKLLAPP